MTKTCKVITNPKELINRINNKLLLIIKSKIKQYKIHNKKQ